MRARLIVLVVALVALAVLPASAGAAAGGKVFVKTSIDTNTLKVRPHQILLSGDGTLGLLAIKYESYGGPVAKATATAYTRGCTPKCAEGKVLRPRATVRFSDLVECEGKMVYGKLSYVLHGPIPSGFERRAVDDIRPIDERGKPIC